jgi:leucyl aminopeptidase
MNFKYAERYTVSEGPIIIGLPNHLSEVPALEEEEIDILLNGMLQDLVEEKILLTEFGAISTTAVTIQTELKKVIAIGLGDVAQLDSKKIHELFGHLFQYLKDTKSLSCQILLDTFPVKAVRGEALGYMSQVSIYEFDNYKKEREQHHSSDHVITVTTEDMVSAEIEKGMTIGKSVNIARDISETPPNFMIPEVFSQYVIDLFKESQYVTGEVKTHEVLEEEGYGLITAVGKGSVNKPRLVTIEYKHPQASDRKPVALVGKGITYDSGGYSIKPKTGMPEMKYDLCGGANVIGMMRAIAELELPVHVIGVVALAENMVDGNAMKPDDVFKAYSGHTVEVKNTDAEGRLVLGDAVFHASQYSPCVILDFATLTGAVIAALDEQRTGVFTNDEQSLLSPIFDCAEEIGEELWRMPISEIEEKKVTSSRIADFTNHVESQGRASFAACFIKQFSNGSPWAHFDIAGTGTTDQKTAFGLPGATGVHIRTIVKYMEDQYVR